MARSVPLTTGTRSAPTTEMYARCRVPARAAARTRFLALSSSPLLLPAQCTMISAPSTAASIPWPVARSPFTYSMPSPASRLRLLSTRTLRPASCSRRTTGRPSVPVPPVTRMSDVIAPPAPSSLPARPAPARASPGPARPGGRCRRAVAPCLVSYPSCLFLDWWLSCPRLSHAAGAGCQCGDTGQRGNVTDGRQRLAGSRLRGAPRSPAGGGLPPARLDDRRRRRGAGHLAAADRRGYQRSGEPRRLADHGRRACVAQHAPVTPAPARGAGRRFLAERRGDGGQERRRGRPQR